jgi:hypothetical protein
MNDYLVSLIRTYVPLAVGAALTWLAANLGVVIDKDTGALAVAAAVGIVTAVYYALARAIEGRWPQLGHVLLALGLRREPMYPSSRAGLPRA